MSFFGTTHLGITPGSQGPSVGFGEGFDIGYDQQYEVDSFYALEDALKDEWKENLDRYREITGVELDVPTDYAAMNNYAAYAQGKEASSWGKRYDAFGLKDLTEQDRRKLDIANERITALGNADVRGFDSILAEVLAKREKVNQRTAEAGAVSTLGGTVGQFIGAMAGSFSARDPVAIGTLPIGGFGRTIAARVATEMGVAGGVEALSQYAKVEPTRALVGEDPGSPFFNVLAAAGGAGILRGAFEGAAKLLQNPIDPPDVELDFRDAELASMFAAADTPRARAGAELLLDQRMLEAASPYGTSQAGMARFTAELDDMRKVLGGLAETSTAIPREGIPFETIKRAADFEIVKERNPALYGKMEEAKARLDEHDARVTQAEQELQNANLSDAVRLVDERAADQVAALEARLAEVTDEVETVALSTEIEVIATRVGKDKIMAALDDAEIAPRKALQRARKERKSLSKKYREATRAVENEQAAIARVAELHAQAQQRVDIDILGHSFTRPVMGSQLSREVIEASVAKLERSVELSEEAASSLVRIANPEPVETGVVDKAITAVNKFLGREAEEGKIDIGLDEPVDADFVLDIDGKSMTIRQLMNDLGEDAKLDEAMGICKL